MNYEKSIIDSVGVINNLAMFIQNNRQWKINATDNIK